ncbi:MAG: T9SS type A sorting domain-containing protein, partial [Muribaculaceae bacterium]|nr:T9SS type A sorting domain-containing protein [Muribaculaceae bacterium]
FKLNLKVTDEEGYSTSRKEFEITPEKLTGFAGNLDFESGWSLAPGTDGIAEILFIPTKNAAPTTPKMYDFGGTISYTDPFTGLDVTRDLEAVRLTVNPSPILDLTYFMQRDVMADDPLTPDVEETSEPAEFAVVVTNKGYGDAKNLKFETRQPEIIDNEKGLAIEFEIESSQLNGAEKTLHLKNSIVNDFGTIEAQKSAYAQWWLRSSLLGHFVDYDVKVTHVTSYDNPDLSLIENASIHELIHGFTVDENAEIPVRGFLVNDIEDKENVPDMVYFSDGKESEMVATGKNAEIKADGENTYIITLPFNPSGWYYYVMKDPTAGNKVVTSVKRMSDGKELPLDNIWQTDRTLLDGKDPMYENRLHFVVNSEESGSYRVEFKDKRENTLEVSDIELLYAEPVEGLKYVDGVRVRFNNSVMDGTFTVDDIAMHRDGTLVALDEAVVTKEDANCYYMALNDIAKPDGEYTFMVIPSGILDGKGFAGGVPRTASWTSSFVAEVVEPVAGPEVRVFPIPMESEVRIECPYREEVRVGIYDSLGKMMYVNDNYISDNPIDVLGWATGVYIIRVVTPEKEHVVKAVKK